MSRPSLPWARAFLLWTLTITAATSLQMATPRLAWSAPATQTSGLTAEQLANAEYYLDSTGETIDPGEIDPGEIDPDEPVTETPITLEDGIYSDDVRTVRLLPQWTRYGDFTGDGVDEAIVILEASPADAPAVVQSSLAILMDQDGAPLNLVTLVLGEAVALSDLEIIGGEIVVNLADNAGLLTQIFVLEDNQVLQYEIPGLTAAQLANTTYTGVAVSEDDITLVDGEYVDEANSIQVQLGQAQAQGDLDGDRIPDVALILASSGGGSGTFVDLAAVLNVDGEPQNVATTFLGDRVRVESLFIEDSLIVLDVVTHGPDDPLCCPSVNARLAFELEESALVEIPIEQPIRVTSAPYGPLFPAPGRLDGADQVGYVNLAGESIIPPRFASALPFAEGLAAVEDPSGLFGYIDASGEYVIEPQFDFAGDFHQGIAVVEITNADGTPGQAYINRQGELLFDGTTFAAAAPFSEGMASVRVESGEYGFIDRTGALVIEPTFDTAQSFAAGLALVSRGGQFGFINRSGRFAIAAQFPRSAPFAEGLAPIELFGQFGYINMLGDLVLPPQFEMAGSFREGFALVTLEGQELYIDAAGNVLNTDVAFTRGSVFHEGLAAVTVDGQVGYLNTAGELAIPPQFAGGGDFENGMAVVRTETTWGVIDPQGEWLLQLPLR